jgi:hypothetical protein
MDEMDVIGGMLHIGIMKISIHRGFLLLKKLSYHLGLIG